MLILMPAESVTQKEVTHWNKTYIINTQRRRVVKMNIKIIIVLRSLDYQIIFVFGMIIMIIMTPPPAFQVALHFLSCELYWF